ncbi:hypothetical protein [Actinorugispora endophytica]|uniref:Uncharacterized protein n=1 Tax=Actinorugispora endophytica TaxID=1605990 RepID=A0A4R6V536_9ACTN|nr:hypothetical protein [Actinorugispora endophytica]TDQ55323.1 hypothetical protein EV190_101648 [Actinorugispora endophytica]
MDGVEFGGLLMLLLGLIVPIGVVIVVVLVLGRGRQRAARSPERWEDRRARGDPQVRELERRLDAGEIDRGEYERLRAEIEKG